MASFVNAADAAAAAVEIERRGHAFYADLVNRADAADDKAFFAFMAQEEKRHEGIFAGMLARLGGVPLPAGSDDGEYLAYVRGLLDSHALFMPDQQERALEAPLMRAVQFEKDTMLFFAELEKMVPESEKKHVRECVEEERGHLMMLMRRMREKK